MHKKFDEDLRPDREGIRGRASRSSAH
jgi:hypothetical protein